MSDTAAINRKTRQSPGFFAKRKPSVIEDSHGALIFCTAVEFVKDLMKKRNRWISMQEKSHAGAEFQVIRPAKDLTGIVTGKVEKSRRDLKKM